MADRLETSGAQAASAQPPEPSFRWCVYLSLFFVGLYLSLSYIAYRGVTLPHRLPAAKELAEAQIEPESPREQSALRRLAQTTAVDHYRLNYTSHFRVAPELRICPRPCNFNSSSLSFALAYGLHNDLSVGMDSWDFWFAPISSSNRWIKSPLRVLYRINPGQVDFWGLMDQDWTDSAVLPSENTIAGIKDLSQTPLAIQLHQIVSSGNIATANRVDASGQSLTLHSSLLDRAAMPFKPPGWEHTGSDVESGLHAIRRFAEGVQQTTTPGEQLHLVLMSAAVFVAAFDLLSKRKAR